MMKPLFTLALTVLSLISHQTDAQRQSQRTLSGVITTGGNEVVAGATITVRASTGELTATSDGEGNFKLNVPAEALIKPGRARSRAAARQAENFDDGLLSSRDFAEPQSVQHER